MGLREMLKKIGIKPANKGDTKKVQTNEELSKRLSTLAPEDIIRELEDVSFGLIDEESIPLDNERRKDLQSYIQAMSTPQIVAVYKTLANEPRKQKGFCANIVPDKLKDFLGNLDENEQKRVLGWLEARQFGMDSGIGSNIESFWEERMLQQYRAAKDKVDFYVSLYNAQNKRLFLCEKLKDEELKDLLQLTVKTRVSDTPNLISDLWAKEKLKGVISLMDIKELKDIYERLVTLKNPPVSTFVQAISENRILEFLKAFNEEEQKKIYGYIEGEQSIYLYNSLDNNENGKKTFLANIQTLGAVELYSRIESGDEKKNFLQNMPFEKYISFRKLYFLYSEDLYEHLTLDQLIYECTNRKQRHDMRQIGAQINDEQKISLYQALEGLTKRKFVNGIFAIDLVVIYRSIMSEGKEEIAELTSMLNIERLLSLYTIIDSNEQLDLFNSLTSERQLKLLEVMTLEQQKRLFVELDANVTASLHKNMNTVYRSTLYSTMSLEQLMGIYKKINSSLPNNDPARSGATYISNEMLIVIQERLDYGNQPYVDRLDLATTPGELVEQFNRLSPSDYQAFLRRLDINRIKEMIFANKGKSSSNVDMINVDVMMNIIITLDEPELKALGEALTESEKTTLFNSLRFGSKTDEAEIYKEHIEEWQKDLERIATAHNFKIQYLKKILARIELEKARRDNSGVRIDAYQRINKDEDDVIKSASMRELEMMANKYTAVKEEVEQQLLNEDYQYRELSKLINDKKSKASKIEMAYNILRILAAVPTLSSSVGEESAIYAPVQPEDKRKLASDLAIYLENLYSLGLIGPKPDGEDHIYKTNSPDAYPPIGNLQIDREGLALIIGVFNRLKEQQKANKTTKK